MDNLKVTLVQTSLHWQDVSANLEMFSEKLAGVKNTDMILLPETFSTGFSMNAKEIAEDVQNSKAIEWMRTTAAEKNCVVTGSLMLKDEGKFYNRLIWMSPDGSFEVYNKRHLFSYAKEDVAYTGGKEKLIVELKGWKICPLICYDLRFPVWSRNVMYGGEPSYDVLLYVANWPERRIQAWKYLLLARAIENQAFVIGVNRTGNDGNDNRYPGDSMVADALGNIVLHKGDEEVVQTFELYFDELKKIREQLQFLKDADSFLMNPRTKIMSH